jgi:hypothetical protein
VTEPKGYKMSRKPQMGRDGDPEEEISQLQLDMQRALVALRRAATYGEVVNPVVVVERVVESEVVAKTCVNALRHSRHLRRLSPGRVRVAPQGGVTREHARNYYYLIRKDAPRDDE